MTEHPGFGRAHTTATISEAKCSSAQERNSKKMSCTTQNCITELETIQHPSGDLILPVILDPAVAAQIRIIAERWQSQSLSEAVSDILLTGLISINSTARLT